MNQRLFLVSVLILVICLSTIQESLSYLSIPPTRAFQRVITSNATVNSNNSTDLLRLTGSGVTITGSDSTNQVYFTVTASGGNMTKLVDAGDVAFVLPLISGQVLTYNGTMWSNSGNAGEANTASNFGTYGIGMWKDKLGVDLRFLKALSANSNLVITSNSSNIIFNATSRSGTVILLSANETDSSNTVKNTDTVLMSYSLPANTYSKIIVESEIELQFGVLSNVQVVNIKIKDGATTKETFVSFSLAQTGRDSLTAKTSFVETTAQTITITQSAVANDAQTTVLAHSLRVYGVI